MDTQLVNDSMTREALSRKEERQFLDFVRTDRHYSRYYEGFLILFKTGMRISEFCGLTMKDIDLKRKTITIDYQLMKVGKKMYIDTTKTKAGKRVIPMTGEVYEAVRSIIEHRQKPRVEPKVDGYVKIEMEKYGEI